MDIALMSRVLLSLGDFSNSPEFASPLLKSFEALLTALSAATLLQVSTVLELLVLRS